MNNRERPKKRGGEDLSPVGGCSPLLHVVAGMPAKPKTAERKDENLPASLR